MHRGIEVSQEYLKILICESLVKCRTIKSKVWRKISHFLHDQWPTLQNNVIPKDFWKVVCFFLEAFFLAARIKDQQDKSHNKQTNNLSKSLLIPLSKLLTYLLYSKPSRSPTVFSKCHPKSSSSSLKLISNEMVLAVSIANQIVVFTSQILRDMAITLTPNSHTHPKPKQFFFFLRKQTTISPIFCFLLLNLHGLFWFFFKCIKSI